MEIGKMFLGLDLGTTNVKAILADADGCVVGRGSAPVSLFHGEGGAVEQDIEEIFTATLSAIAAAGAGANLSKVRAIGVSSQGGALQLLDGGGRPLGRAISWLDRRGGPYNEAVTRKITPQELAQRTGHPRACMALGQLLRLRTEQPELLAPPNGAGFVGDVIVERLCSRRAHDGTSLSCAVLFDPSRRTVDTGLLERVGIDEEQLPVLISPREPAGPLREDVAERTNLPAGIPVGPAVHDQYASALGVAVTAAGDVMFGAGTAWVLLAVSEHVMAPVAGAGFSCTHLVDGLYGQIISMTNGGSAVAWALKAFGLEGRTAGEIDALLESVGAGSDGLRCRAFLAGGGAGLPLTEVSKRGMSAFGASRGPASGGSVLPRDAKCPPRVKGLAHGAAGRLWGLRLSHTSAHVLRAVVEGLVMELRRYLGMCADAGLTVDRLVMCGGAAGGRITPQIVADATGLPVTCAAESDTGALGAAMLARGLIEPAASLAGIAAEMTPSTRDFNAGTDASLYDDMFGEYLDSLASGEGTAP